MSCLHTLKHTTCLAICLRMPKKRGILVIRTPLLGLSPENVSMQTNRRTHARRHTHARARVILFEIRRRAQFLTRRKDMQTEFHVN